MGVTGGDCLPFNGGVLPLCFARCHPVDPECVTGTGCYPTSETAFSCIPPAADAATAGGECADLLGCESGTFCADAAATPGCGEGAAGCCAPYCDAGGDGSECAGPSECVQWFEASAPEGYEDVGG